MGMSSVPQVSLEVVPIILTYQLPKKQSGNLTQFQCHQPVNRACHSLSPVTEHQSCLLERQKYKFDSFKYWHKYAKGLLFNRVGFLNLSTQSSTVPFVHI